MDDRTAVESLIDEFFETMDSRDRRVKILGTGEAACFSDVLDVAIRSDAGTTRLEKARLTGVAEKRDDRWVLVQTHLSLPRA